MNTIFNRKSKLIYIALMSFALLFSCKKILDPDVIDIPTDGNAITSAADVDKALAGAYSFLREVVPDKVFLMGDMRADVFSSYSQVSNVRTETLIATNTSGQLLNNAGGDWRGFYRTIAQCNLILEKISTISVYDEVTRKKHIGEASFIRALSYFYLVRFWGDVPLNLKSVDFSNIPRSPQAEVFKQINADLDVAIANLQVVYNTADKAVRATKGAAWAIKAHVMGWTQDYATCEKLCDSVITRGQYSLVTDTNNLISIFVGKSSEGIFELNFDATLKEVQKNRVYNRTLGRPWYSDGSDGGGGTERFLLSPTRTKLNQMFIPGTRDARRFTWFVKEYYINPNIPNDRIYLGKYRTLQAKGDTSSQNINESNIIITRLPDIMLLRAEALASPAVGRTAEAVTLLNAVRRRAYASLYTGGGNLQDTILLERKKELIGEGQYFFDLVRTRKLATDSKITQADWFQKGAWLLPIDQTIIAKSDFVITQNEYWR
ncbi:RagB/SusD family nutrient uptake outer membrane protein [Pedobacter metabolipauper]|uniref:SusD-like starch-binding protein associating with outer membrane n=1 Tax=Pedobacter metabolipauper TaxID=425513 RepID=A0A4R6STG2_9SPHI|nr:RagB/SusD family nutrient uptake outer membrane protein [Pedobacter metabolipauper]TDQ07334.1 SusD-like starch-binding protein associating with outer membrane [Pedobacter metabolipauper]